VSLGFDVRPSDTPLVDCVWRCRSSDVGQLVSVSSSHWHLVVGEIEGLTEVTVHGPETRATKTLVPPDATWVGIRFRLGAVLQDLSVAGLVDRSLTLPPACHRSFWWKGTAWRLPTYDNAEGLVGWLVREDLIGSEPVVDDVLRGTSAELSLRTIQRRFHAATGLTRRAVRQIERARLAGVRLREGTTPAEVTHELGYFDQPHLTRSLRRFLGQTPVELADPSRDEQLSLLYKTDAAGSPAVPFERIWHASSGSPRHEQPVTSVQDRCSGDPYVAVDSRPAHERQRDEESRPRDGDHPERQA
jgi:AraC-like DNA-binding protein